MQYLALTPARGAVSGPLWNPLCCFHSFVDATLATADENHFKERNHWYLKQETFWQWPSRVKFMDQIHISEVTKCLICALLNIWKDSEAHVSKQCHLLKNWSNLQHAGSKDTDLLSKILLLPALILWCLMSDDWWKCVHWYFS